MKLHKSTPKQNQQWAVFYFIAGVFFGIYELYIKEYYYLLVFAILGGLAGIGISI